MNFSEARRSKGWIVLLATVVGISVGGYSFIKNARENHVYTLTCGIVDYKPGVFFKSCADGGIAVGQIEWESWSKAGAHGKGIYAVNDCTPDCAQGTLIQVPVDITLTGNNPLDIVRNKKVLNKLEIKSLEKKFLPYSSSNRQTWLLE